MLRDRGSGGPRDVNQTIRLEPVPPSWRQGVQKYHIPVVASSDETHVEQYGSGHDEQPGSYKTIPKERDVSMVTMRAVREGVGG